MGVGRMRKAAQVFNHPHRVLIDRVGMKKVMLHLADHASERGNQATEHAPLVHEL